MGYVAFHLIFAANSNLLDQFKFLLGISSFSGIAIVTAFLAGHIPYAVYFFSLKIAIARILLRTSSK
jgi:hypothetical protein